MTRLRFSGGEVIQVALPIDQVRELVQRALASQTLLELEGRDGNSIVINPQQVQYFQDAQEYAAMNGPSSSNGVAA